MNYSHVNQYLVRALVGLAIAATIGGCGGSNVPNPTSRDVRELVLSVSVDIIRNALLQEEAQAETGITAAMLPQYGYPEFDFEVWASMREESEKIERVVSRVEERTKDLGLRLKDVLVESKDKTLGRVACQAQLQLANGKSLEIRYLAQYTEDGRLYVEVELLD